MNPARLPRPAVWIALALALVTLAVYWPATRHDFVDYDDNFFVTKNAHVQKGLARENLSYAFTTRDAYLWHPLTWYSHMMDCQLFGMNAGRHHLTGLLFHAANAALLFLALLRLTKNLWPSAAVAALFAWHPFHVESVAWVAERKDVLSCFFWCLALWAYARYAEKPSAPRYLVVTVLFALGLMAKPMVVTLPFVLLLLDFWPLKRISFENPGTAPAGKASAPPQFWPHALKLVLEKTPLFALSAVVSVISFHITKTGGAVVSTEIIPLGARLVNAVVSYATYVVKTFWPVNFAVYYPHDEARPWWVVLGAAALLAAVTWLAAAGWRRRPWLLVGWLWFLGTLVPVIQIVQSGSHAMADRYTYIPLTGVFILLAWGVPGWLGRARRENVSEARNPKLQAASRSRGRLDSGFGIRASFDVRASTSGLGKWALAAATAVALLACLALTRAQLTHWRDTFSLFQHALNVTKNNYMSHKSVADVLIDRREFDAGIRHYHEALKAAPKFAEVHNNLGVAYFKAGQFTNAIEPFRRAVECKPGYAAAHKNLGNALVSAGRPAEAVASYEAALRLQPDFAEARNYLGLALFKLGRHDEAIPNYLEALRLQPSLTGARYDLGLIYFRQSKFDEAAREFTAVLQTNPADANAHYQLALVRVTQHKAGEALPHLREALRLKPDSLQALNALAWILATHEQAELRNGTEALRLAEQLVRLSPQPNVALLNTLAAAQAEAGQFAAAITTVQQALGLAQKSGPKELAAQLEQRLALYRQNKPFRDAALSPPKPRVTVTPIEPPGK